MPHRFTSQPLSSVPKKTRGRKKDQLTKKLTEIYENDDGSMPDMRQFRPRHRHRFLRAVVTFLFSAAFFATIAWVGFFVIEPRQQFSEDDVLLNVSGGETVVPGEEVRYRLLYENGQHASLQEVVLHVRYPDGFVFATSTRSPDTETHDSWSIGNLSGGDSGTIDIVGRLFGDVKQKQSLRAFISYRPENFSSEFQKVATQTTEINAAPLGLSLSVKPEVTIGAKETITLAVEPQGGARPEHLIVALEPSDTFVPLSSVPSGDGSPTKWYIDVLDGTKTFTITGTFVDTGVDATSVSAVVRGFQTEKREGDGYVYDEETQTAKLVRTSVQLSLGINGTLEDSPVRPGDRVSGSIVVKNTGTEPQTNVSVRAIFDAPSVRRQSVLDWPHLVDEANGDVVGEQLSDDIRRGTIVWTAAEVPVLRELGPQEEVTIDFHLPVKNSSDVDLTEFPVGNIRATAEVHYGLKSDRQIRSANPITLTLLSDTDIEVRDDREVDNQGREAHTVSWILTNSLHSLSSTTIETDVYGDVSIDPMITAPIGQAVFDSQKKKIVWTIDTLPITLDTAALQFSVLLNKKNPTQTQLTSKVRLKAYDMVVNHEILLVGDEIQLR